MTHTRNMALIPVLCLLAACGSGTSTPSSLSFANGEGSAPVLAISNANNALVSSSGTLDFATNSFDAGILTGSTNSSRTNVMLSSGGTARLTDGTTRSVRRFTADPTTGARHVGVVGLSTQNMPTSGTAQFAGDSAATIRDGQDLYELTGRANISANFGAGTVDVTLSELSGTLTPGLGTSQTVTNVATLAFTNAQISQSRFSGDTVELNSTTLNGGAALAAGTNTAIQGGFFGNAASETGGAFAIEGIAGSNFAAQGDFLGAQ